MKVDDICKGVPAHLLASAETKRQVAERYLDPILAAADLIAKSFRRGDKLMLCGNGGSAADCQHMGAELVSRLTKDFERSGLPAIALTTDTSFLTAYANDIEYGGVLAQQVQALGKPGGDTLIGMSTSGNSLNVIPALETATAANIHAIVPTGNGGRLSKIADIAIAVPSGNTQYIQEAHLAIQHILCDLVERILFRPQRESATA